MTLQYEETMDFVKLHYLNSTYNSKFWSMVEKQEMTEALKERISMYKKFGYKIKAPDFKGSYVLVCPSSNGINNYLDMPNWTNDTIEQIKRYTDRPIRLRHKPRGRGTSGPSEAKVPLSEDLKDAWCVVTSCSLVAVEAQCMGIPVICHEKSFAKEIAGQDLADIEDPFFVGAEEWLWSLAYQQFTPDEIANGKAVEIMLHTGVL